MSVIKIPILDLQTLLNFGPEFELAVKNTFKLMQKINFAHGFVFYSLDHNGRVSTAVSEGIDAETVALGAGVVGMIDNSVLFTDDPEHPLALDKKGNYHIWMPMFVDQAMGIPGPGQGLLKIGVLYAPHKEFVTSEQIRTLYIVATQAAIGQINANHMQIWRTVADLSVAQVPLGIIVTSWHGRVLTANQAAKDILGFKFEGISLAEPRFEEVWAPIREAVTQSAQDKKIRDLEVDWQSNTEQSMRLKFRITLDYKDNQYYIVTMTVEDVTVQRRLEQALERSNRLKAISDLVAGAAHEIRNPLAGLRGAVQYLARDQRLREEKGKYLTLLVSEIDRIDGIVEKLLTFARPQAPKREPVILGALADQVLLLLESQLLKGGIQVQREYDLAEILADGEQLKQVLLNLFLNALEAMSQGGKLQVSVKLMGQVAVIKVEDTGPGIPPELLERIWHPFQSGKERGTGLGLSIVHSIITAHRGQVRAANTYPGACFTIELPREESI